MGGHFLSLILSAAAGLLLLGIGLVVVGLRGRQTDDHRLCRRCGYDLTGSTAGRPWPECGADLARRRAVRVGHRTRRRVPLAVGGILTLGLTAALSYPGWVGIRRLDPTPYKPTWWLRHDLTAGQVLRGKAWAELTRRVTAGQLSAGQTAAVADVALANQASPAPWDPAWGTFLEAADAARHLDRTRWATYARQAFKLSLHPSPTSFASLRRLNGVIVDRSVTFPGQSLNLLPLPDISRLTKAKFTAVFQISDIKIGSRLVTSPPPSTSRRPDRAVPLQTEFTTLFVDGPTKDWAFPIVNGGIDVDDWQKSGFPPGVNTVWAKVRVLVYGKGFIRSYYTMDEPPRDSPKLLIEFDTVAAGSVTIGAVPAASVEPSNRAAVAASIRDVSIIMNEAGDLVVRGVIDSSPARLGCSISLKPASGYGSAAKFQLRHIIDCPAGKLWPFEVTQRMPSWRPVPRCDVTFRPEPKDMAGNTDPTPIWGEDIVVRGVPVVVKPRSRSFVPRR